MYTFRCHGALKGPLVRISQAKKKLAFHMFRNLMKSYSKPFIHSTSLQIESFVKPIDFVLRQAGNTMYRKSSAAG